MKGWNILQDFCPNFPLIYSLQKWMLVAEIQNQSPDLVDKFHRKPHVYKVGKCTMPSILKCVLHGYKSASVISVKGFWSCWVVIPANQSPPSQSGVRHRFKAQEKDGIIAMLDFFFILNHFMKCVTDYFCIAIDKSCIFILDNSVQPWEGSLFRFVVT